MSDIDPDAVKAAHAPSQWRSDETGPRFGPPYSLCIKTGDDWPCETYLLAEALAAEPEQIRAAVYESQMACETLAYERIAEWDRANEAEHELAEAVARQKELRNELAELNMGLVWLQADRDGEDNRIRAAVVEAESALAAEQAKVARVEALLAIWDFDENEHLNMFGQHLPASVSACADHLRAALADQPK